MTSSLPNDNGVLGSNKEAILSDPGAQLRTNTEPSFLGFNSMSPVYQRPDDPEPFRVNTFILFVGMPLAAIVFPLWATMATDFATAAKNKWIHWWLGDQQPIKRDGSPDWTVVSGYDCSQPQTCLLTDSVGDATFGILEDSESTQPSSYLSFDEAGNVKSRKGCADVSQLDKYADTGVFCGVMDNGGDWQAYIQLWTEDRDHEVCHEFSDNWRDEL
ncbi:hypothetical protein E3Q11_03038 [Wallemia mellicola]|nr:hypothetical protein E3Q11_03038 [Wallemia mellicola]TIC71807.1 hypothetical protein E3Q00_04424 [Wallemia mellicola]